MIEPTGEVHPVADLFPMMSDDELADLAADIAANGLIHPVVLDADGMLIDGRNRLAACRLAGVEPTFTSLNGHDPVAFILSANIQRRHLSKGQAAMAAARARLVSRQSVRAVSDSSRIDRSRIGYAAIVLEFAADLADAVLSGATGLDDAYAEARRRKEAASGTIARMERLRAKASDLADLVTEERMTLAEAEAAERVRDEDARRARDSARALVEKVAALLNPHAADPTQDGARLFEEMDVTEATPWSGVPLPVLRRCREKFAAFVACIERAMPEEA